MKQWKEILMIAMTVAVILLCGQFPELLAKDRKEDRKGWWAEPSIFSPSSLPLETCQRKQKEKCISFELSKANVLQKRDS